jgi:hypothetical protein
MLIQEQLSCGVERILGCQGGGQLDVSGCASVTDNWLPPSSGQASGAPEMSVL